MLAVQDGFDAFLLGCFFFGLVFAATALLGGLGGVGHVHLYVHLPTHAGHFHLPHHGPSPGGHHGHRGVGPLNTSSLLVFVSWFGGWAYLARNGLDWILAFSLIVGLIGGLAGGGLMFLWLAKVLVRMETALDPADYRMPGTIARVTSSIRAGGVGEIVYEQGGVRQVSAARTRDGSPIPRGTEVVVRDRERGIASVEPWDSFLGERHRDLIRSTVDHPVAVGEDASERRPRSPEQPHDPGDAWANREPMVLPPPAA